MKTKEIIWWIKFCIILVPLAIISVLSDYMAIFLAEISEEIDEYLENNNYYDQDFNKKHGQS